MVFNKQNRKIFMFLFFIFIASSSYADECKNRGELDILYCDENHDLVADPPKNPEDFKNPRTLVFAVNPLEDMDFTEKLYSPLTEHLTSCTNKKTIFYQVQNNAAQIESMRSGRLHIAGFSTGSAPFAVNVAGAIPFATFGYSDDSPRVDNLIVVVNNKSSYKKLSDLKDKKVAHASPSANIGHMAPIALFPKQGVVPGKDYKIIFAGKYDQSIAGVLSGDYDAAVMGKIFLDNFVITNNLDKNDFRIIYEDDKQFISSATAYANDLEPKLVEKIKECFFSFKLTKVMTEHSGGSVKYVPITYKEDYAIVREIAEKNEIKFNKSAFDKSNSKN